MYEKRQATLSAFEVLDVAKRLRHPDARLDEPNLSRQERARRLVRNTGSVFFHFLDEGLIVEVPEHEQRREEGAPRGPVAWRPAGSIRGVAFQFVFETYFEYTLGRYFTQVRWPKLVESGEPQGVVDPEILPQQVLPEAILDDFEELLKQHAVLVGEVNFTNLFGALQFAVLIAEDSAVYRETQKLFLRMLRRMSFDSKKQRLDWSQLACATIRETYLVQAAEEPVADTAADEELADAQLSSGTAESRPEALDPSRVRRFSAQEIEVLASEALDLLEALVRPSDFVITWDVRDTLAALGRHHPRAVFERLEHWILRETENLLPICAMESLEQLIEWAPQESLDLLVEAGRVPSVTGSFWLARSWVRTAVTILKRREALLEEEGGGGESTSERRREAERFRLVPADQWRDVFVTLRAFAEDSPLPVIRGVALPAMALMHGDRETFTFLRERIAEEKSPWVLWNLAFELRRWPWELVRTSEVWELLRELADKRDDHVLYAVDSTLLRFIETRQSAEARRLRPAIACKTWCAFSREYGPKQKMTHGDPSSPRTGIVYTPAYFEPAYDNHVECRERLQAMMSEILRLDPPSIDWLHPEYAKEAHLESVHGRDVDGEVIDIHRGQAPWPTYVADVRLASQARREQKGRTIRSGPTELRYESYEAALLSAGGAVCGVDYVLSGVPSARVAWSMGRPPGHLANNHICIFNNIAIAATYALERMRATTEDPRILIVDCDAHQGIHTNRVFQKDPSVVYFSLHVEGSYAAEQGDLDNIGFGDGRGYNFNVPYPKNMGDVGYRFLIDHLLVPALDDFEPDLIMISAGFDGHFEDPMTPDCLLSEHAYIHLAKRLREAADRSPKAVKFVGGLEGGYGLEANAKSLAHMLNILGDWGLPDDDIGFVEPKDVAEDKDNRPNFPMPAGDRKVMAEVREITRQRIRLVLEVARESASYPFRSSRWSELADELSSDDSTLRSA